MADLVDYFISYTLADKTWAEWIGWVLEEDGATVRLQAWDFVPGSNFVLEMQRAAREARRTIAVLSPDYLKSRFAAPEWASAFVQDPEGLARRLVPVRVRDCELKGMLQTIVHIDLIGRNETAARKALSDGLGSKRGKPDRAPPFPGPISDEPLAHDPRAFPDATQPVPSTRRPSSYLPKARGAVSDLDRRRFVKGTFETIRKHFEASFHAFAGDPAVDAELTHRGDTEFVAEVFVHGKRKARCRVWLGGMLGGNEISYYEGEHDMGNAVNESLTIAQEQQDGLALNTMMSMGIGMKSLAREIDTRRMSPEHAAEYLWHRFLWRLELAHRPTASTIAVSPPLRLVHKRVYRTQSWACNRTPEVTHPSGAWVGLRGRRSRMTTWRVRYALSGLLKLRRYKVSRRRLAPRGESLYSSLKHGMSDAKPCAAHDARFRGIQSCQAASPSVRMHLLRTNLPSYAGRFSIAQSIAV